MDSQRFDELTRLIGSGATRRRVLMGALGSLAGLAFMRKADGASAQTTCTVAADCASDESCLDTDDSGTGTCQIFCSTESSFCYDTIRCCAGLVCSEGTCRPAPCASDDECTGGTICCNDVCAAIECCTNGGPDPDHCAEGQLCSYSVCIDEDEQCQNDSDCRSFSICCSGACRRGVRCCVEENDPTNPRCDEGETCVNGDYCDVIDEPEPEPEPEPPSGEPGTEEDPDTATVTIHFAACPTGTSDLFGQCHDNGIGGVSFTISSDGDVRAADTGTVTTDGDGVASASVGVGSVTVAGGQTADALGTYVYCAEQTSGTVLYDGNADSASVSFTVAEGDEVVCDWYRIVESVADNDNADDDDDDNDDDNAGHVTALPDTGSGVERGSDLNGWIGAAALGAAAAALAGKKLRDTSGDATTD